MNKQKFFSITITFVVILSLASLSFNLPARLPVASSPNLGAAASFSVLAALSMSAAGAGTTVSGDLGLSPGIAISRTGPWTVGGTEYFGPASLAGDAQNAALGAFNNLAGQTKDGDWIGQLSLTPGVWKVASDITFTGTITLNGSYNDVWVIQVGGDMIFSGSVVLAGNAQACHVFWQIGRDVTIASGSSFAGILIASRNITLVSGAAVNGRIISLNGALTTDGNNIYGPICLSAPVATNTTAPTATNTNTPSPTNTNTPSPINTNTPSPTNTTTPGATNTTTPGATNTTTPGATKTPAPGFSDPGQGADTPTPRATNTTAPGFSDPGQGADTPTPRATNTTAPIGIDATATLLPGVGLPSTGGGPIQNEAFPWGLLLVGGFSLMAVSLGVRAYRRRTQ